MPGPTQDGALPKVAQQWALIPSSPTVGAALWLLCFQYFVAEQVARHGWSTPYSMVSNYISDLGAVACRMHAGSGLWVCSPLHRLMNASFILQGMLIFFGAVLVRSRFPAGRVWTAARWLIAIAGPGVLLVGLYPEDVNLPVHDVGAIAHFLCGNLGVALLGLAMSRWSPRTRLVGSLSVFAGLVGLTATLLFFADIDLGLGVGGMERIAAYPLPLWLTAMGAFLLSTRRSNILV